MKRKFFAAFLSLCMVMSLVPMTALATGDEETEITASTQKLESGTYYLDGDVTLTSPISIEKNTNITINGNGNTISYSFDNNAGTKVAFTGSDTSQVEGIPAGVNLTIKNVKFENTSKTATSQGYAVLIGGNSYGTKVTLEKCTFTNLYTAVYANQYTTSEENKTAPEITISGCTYVNTAYGYSLDEVTVGAYVGDEGTQVTFDATNTGVEKEKEVYQNVVYLNDKSYGNGTDALSNALSAAQNGDTIQLTPGEYTAPGTDRYAGPVVSLIGAGTDETTIKGGLWMGGTGDQSIDVTGPIEISGISFENTDNGWSNSGLGFSHIDECDITVDGCEFSGFQHGVHMNTSKATLTVEQTSFENVGVAMSAQSDTGTLKVGEGVDTAGAALAVQAFGNVQENGSSVLKDYYYTTTDAYEKATAEASGTGMDRFDNSKLDESDVVSGTVKTVTDSEELTNALENATDGTVIVLAPGTYELSNGITLNNKVTIQGAGDSTIIKSSESGNYTNGLIDFEGGSEGSVLKDLTIEYTSTGVQNAAVYFGYGFTGGSEENVTKIQNVTFTGNSDLDKEKAIAISSTYTAGGYVEITGCTIKNFAYGMYFNGIHDLTIEGNTIDSTKYNAINVAGDNAGYECKNIVIQNNTLTNIATADYPDDTYSSGINVGENASSVEIKDNDITMSNGNKAIHLADGIKGSYTVTYVNDGKQIDVAVVTEGSSVKLPILPDQGHNHFVGWTDQAGKHYDGGETVTITADTTFTAQWAYIPPANPNYKITIGDMENGTVTANPTAAKAGATVTLTPVPDEGYALSTLTVTDRFGDAVRVTENSDGTYTFTMPNGQVTVTATFVETEAPVDEPFVDVAEGDWFYDAVVYAYQNKLMDGVGGNRFAPNSETTRAQLVTILYRLEGEPAVSGDLPFTDVEAGTWYTNAVLWAAQNGIVNGVTDTTFAPGNDLTREQLVTILYRYAQDKGYDVSASADLSGYPDADQVQDYAQPAMAWAVAENIIQGMEDGTLKPAGNASRAQIATILMRFCEDVAQ